MNTHNTCFCWVIKDANLKLYVIPLLSEALHWRLRDLHILTYALKVQIKT